MSGRRVRVGAYLCTYHREVKTVDKDANSSQGGRKITGKEYRVLDTELQMRRLYPFLFWMGDHLSHQQQCMWAGAVGYSVLLLEYLMLSTLYTRRGGFVEEILRMCLGLISFRSAGLLCVHAGEFREKPERWCACSASF